MKRAKKSVKVAIASALAISSTAAVIYAAPKILEATASEGLKENVYLDVEKMDSDTIKISLDNIEDIAKSLQFSIKLDDNVRLKKDESGNYLITDLLAEEIDSRIRENSYSSGNSIITDYTYNEDSNIIDVLITSEDSLPKIENKIEIFKLDIEAKENRNKSFTIIPEGSYKYVSKDSKEYANLNVDYNNELINLNTAPTIKYIGDEINIHDGEELVFDEIKELIKEDADKDDVTLEVRNITNVIDESKEDYETVITKFSSEEVGTYTFKIYAIDSVGEKSEPIKLTVNVTYDLTLEAPTIIGADDIVLQSGEVFNPLEGVLAKDSKGRELNVTVSGDLNLNPEEDTEYILTYKAVDKYGKISTKDRKIIVKANNAPIIIGVENAVINIGDKFDPKAGIKVEDDNDKNLIDKLVIEGKVNTLIAGEYKLNYSVKDSGGKISRAQRVIRVNRAPIVTGNDSALVVKKGIEISKEMVLGGVNIIDETEYDINVDIPIINEPGRYEAKITVTDIDNGITIVTRNIIVTNDSIVELPNSGQGGSQEDIKVIQVTEDNGIAKLNKELSDVTKEYKLEMKKKNFTEYVQYNFVISKKEAAFRDTGDIYLQVIVPNEIESSTGGIKITEYVEVLATEVKIDNKENLNHYIKKGDEIELTATIKPDNATNKELDWISTDEEVVDIIPSESGIKIVAKEYGIATIRVGAKDGSQKYDEFTFNVSHDFNELPEDISIVGGDATEDAPLIYETENIESLKKLLSNTKDEFKVLLYDKESLEGNKIKYYLKLEKSSIVDKLIGREKSYYIAFILPNSSEFDELINILEKNDTKAPKLVYNGDMEIVLENGSDFEVPVVTAKDNLDGDILVNYIIKDGNGKKVDRIDTTIAGDYTITYSASDKSGNKSELIIKVTIEEKTSFDNIELGDGDGSLESPMEIIVSENASLESINGLLGDIKNKYNFEFIGQPQEDEEEIVFKMKLKEKISTFKSLLGKAGEVKYIEIKIPKVNTEAVKVLNDLYNSMLEDIEKPEETVKPEETNKPEEPDENETLVDKENVKKDDLKMPNTGGNSVVGMLGIGTVITALGGLLIFKKKDK